MVAIITTNKILAWKIYASDNPNSCVVDVEGDIEFSFSMGYNDIECSVKREPGGVYSKQVGHRVIGSDSSLYSHQKGDSAAP